MSYIVAAVRIFDNIESYYGVLCFLLECVLLCRYDTFVEQIWLLVLKCDLIIR